MNVYDRAKRSFQNILKTRLREVRFLDRVTGDIAFTANGQVTRIEGMIDPQTNLQIRVPVLAVTISVLDMPEGTTQLDIDDFPNRYLVDTEDTLGTPLICKLVEPPRTDYTIGFTNLLCRAVNIDEGV